MDISIEAKRRNLLLISVILALLLFGGGQLDHLYAIKFDEDREWVPMATLWVLFWLGLWRYHIDPNNRPHSFVEEVREHLEQDEHVRSKLETLCNQLIVEKYGKAIKSTRGDGKFIRTALFNYHYRRFIPHSLRLRTEAFTLTKTNRENAGEDYLVNLSSDQSTKFSNAVRVRALYIGLRQATNNKTFFDYAGPYIVSLPIAFYFLLCAPTWLLAQ